MPKKVKIIEWKDTEWKTTDLLPTGRDMKTPNLTPTITDFQSFVNLSMDYARRNVWNIIRFYIERGVLTINNPQKSEKP